MEMTPEIRLKRAKSDIIAREPFFTSMLLKQKSIANRNIPKLLVNGEEIHYNPQYIGECRHEQIFFDLLTATAHNVLMHPFRAKYIPDLDLGIFNKAAGIGAINMIHECGYDLPEGYEYHDEFKDWPVEKIYKLLKDMAEDGGDGEPDPNQQPQQQQGDGGAGGGGQGDDSDDDDGEGEGGGGSDDDHQDDGGGDDDQDDDKQDDQQQGGDGDGDDDDKQDDGGGDNQDDHANDNTPDDSPCHIEPHRAPKGSQEEQMAQENMKLAIQQAAVAQKKHGKGMSANLERLVREIREPKIPPEEILHRFLHDKVREGNDWKRPNKRFSGDVYMPSHSTIGLGNNIVCAFDSSCSISTEAIEEMIAEVFAFLEQIEEAGADPLITAIYCDSKICGVEQLSSDTKPNPRGGGCTSFAPVWEYLAEHQEIEPKGIIYFTDGECYGKPYVIGEHGEDIIRDVPILWILTEKNEEFEEQIEAFGFGECLTLPSD